VRTFRPVIFTVMLSLLSVTANPQQASTSTTPIPRDARAVLLLRQAASAMAAVPPSDSTATGNVTIVAGSSTTNGTVTIQTKGSSESSIQFQVPTDPWKVVFASGQANKVETSQTTVYTVELAASSQCLYFPLPYLLGILNNPDYSIQYVGQETLNGAAVNHLVVQNTFNSATGFQFLASFTTADIWIDASTLLPAKIAMIRRDGGGSRPKIPISVAYSNYKSVSGVLYPFTIQEYITETLWATTTIQSVSFNTGLTDASFTIQEAN